MNSLPGPKNDSSSSLAKPDESQEKVFQDKNRRREVIENVGIVILVIMLLIVITFFVLPYVGN